MMAQLMLHIFYSIMCVVLVEGRFQQFLVTSQGCLSVTVSESDRGLSANFYSAASHNYHVSSTTSGLTPTQYTDFGSSRPSSNMSAEQRTASTIFNDLYISLSWIDPLSPSLVVDNKLIELSRPA